MDLPIESKLKALLKLQTIDSKIDQIIKLRGALPEEVEDLNTALDRFKKRNEDAQEELGGLEKSITDHKELIKKLEALIKKYETQQMEVRNNREYDAITKEIDLQKLEIQLLEKRIKEAYTSIETKKVALEEGKSVIEKNNQQLLNKQKELETLTEESEEEEKKLSEQRTKVLKKLDSTLQKTYTQIRNHARNKLAVVSIINDACSGCFNQVPPQTKINITENKKIVMCEHCGRIIADVAPEAISEE